MKSLKLVPVAIAGILLLSLRFQRHISGDCGSAPKRAAEIVNHTPDDLAKRVIESFKELDITLFSESAFTLSDAESMVRKMQGLPKEAYPPPFQDGLQRWETNYVETIYQWCDTYIKGKQAGICWRQATFERAEYKILEVHGIIRCSSVDAVFSVGDELYKVQIDDCFRTNRGWLAADQPVWKGRVSK